MPVDPRPSPPCALAPGRRRLLGAGVAVLAGCASADWPDLPGGAGSPSARERLRASAEAQGLVAWRQLHGLVADLEGHWPGLAPANHPAAAWRLHWWPGERQLQLHEVGPAGAADPPGRLRWVRTLGGGGPAGLRGWAGGQPVTEAAPLAAAARAADLLALLLGGAMALHDSGDAVHWGPPQDIGGRRCDQLMLVLRPGLGFAAADRLSLFVDREQALARRLRVPLDAADTAPAEIDLVDPFRQQGLWWPGGLALWPARGWPGRSPAPAPRRLALRRLRLLDGPPAGNR